MSDLRTQAERVVELALTPLTRDAFAPFGDLIEPTEDGVPFGPDDACLDLSQGTPRFYIMRLPARGLVFRRITRHRCTTQCLAALEGKSWLIAVAPPRDIDDPAAEPTLEEIKAFRVPGNMAIKLHRGTWHAGPSFAEGEIDFVNLELADTNEVDHQNSMLAERFGFALRFAA
ncbi:MAG: ureidoglycolate hydrolase [Rhodospirillales bacterium]|jgi:ureidoglycolate lyase|nr:ureidoglycolate hydrolase [Rhodospirillales bacterium]